MKKLIIIADWGHDSLTCQEVRSATEGHLTTNEHPNITFVASTPSTIHTGYLINQVVEIEERFGKPKETVIFENTDPRIQTKNGVRESQGAEFIIIHLKPGLYLCGPNAGYNFSFIKPKINNVFLYKDLNKGSQFRSRDLYSKVSAILLENKQDSLMLEKEDASIIPDLDGSYIGHIDNYGNIKTTVQMKDFHGKYKFGDEITVEINDVRKKVKYVDNLFGGKEGELVIYPGSSGEKDNYYLEITVWRHFTEDEKTTGTHAFNNPHPGDRILILDKV